MKKILKNPLFLWTSFANLMSDFGDVVYYLALMNYVLLLEQSNLALSVITLSESIPIFFQFFTGYWADRTKHKIRVIQLTLLLRVSFYLILGWVMSFQPALWILIVAAAINFISDIAGYYENGLFIPVNLRMISNEDRGDFLGFSQGLQMAGMIIFQAAGALLISIMSHSQLAYLNALSFLIPLIVMTSLKQRFNRLFDERPYQGSDQSLKQQGNILKRAKSSVKEVLDEMNKIPEIKLCLVIAPVINGIFAVFPAILTLTMKANPAFQIRTPVFTLAIFQTLMILGAILGSFLVMSLLKKVNLEKLLFFSVGLTFLMSICLYFQNIFGLLLVFFIIGVISGAINPKLNTAVMNSVAEDKIGRINGGIGTYFQMGVLLMRIIFSGLFIFVSAKELALSSLAISLIFILFVYYSKRKEKSIKNEVSN